NYVTEGSPLDVEALRRGTSVYLVDRVIPMLPHKLSNGICSLNMGTDRLALSCLMDIDKKGNVVNHKIAETLINVDRRMTYTNVRKILSDKDQEVISEYKDFVKMFEEMEELAAILRDKRKRRGSIDFDFAETKVILNEKGEPIDIIPYDRNVATKIIEEFMLLANETIAEDFFWQELPFVYRTHEEPDPERLATLGSFIHNFGYNIKGEGEIHPKEIQKLLIEIEGKPEEAIISRLALRSMKRACYTVTGDGHYGLATKYYTHFTSPIRRYPDLQIHRIIKENLNGKMEEKRIRHFNAILPNVAKQTSETERTAEEAERETIKLKKVQYMEKHIGEKFEGVISGVTAWGLYVELPNTVEGLVHVTTLDDDYYIFDEKKHIFIGERTSKIYRMGESVKIAVLSVNKVERTIDFELVNEDTEEEE
uniref:ribonuclease R family protein n=1 Tax=Vallitalea guaymasensis TaxID=1185412 RepID=UPI00272C37BD